MLGMEMREILGLLHPEDRAMLERIRREFGNDGPDVSYELRVATHDGRRLWLAADSRRVMFGGEPARQLICRDITELKLTEEALTRRLQLEELVARASTRFINLEPDQLDAEIESTLGEVAEFAVADHAYVFAIGPDGDALGCTHERVSPGQASHRAALQGLSLTRLYRLATRLQERGVLAVPRVRDVGDEAQEERELCARSGIESLLLAPMTLGDRVVGFMALDSATFGREWSEDVGMLLRMASSVISSALARGRAVEQLRLAREMAQALLNAATDVALLLDREGRVLALNEVASRHLRKSPSELIARSLWEILPADMAEQRGVQFQEAIRTKRPRRFEDARDENNWDNHVFPVFDAEGEVSAVAVYARDVTAQRQAERAVRESEAHFRALFEHAPVGIVMYDAQARPIVVNRQLQEMLGYSEEELLAEPLPAFMHPAHRDRAWHAFRQLAVGDAGEGYRVERAYLHREGGVLWGRVAAGLIRDASGVPRFVVVMVDDITAERQAQDELRRLNAELEQRVSARTADLEATNAELESFSYSVSHDLRAPLRRIQAFARILREDYATQLAESGRGYLAQLEEAGRSMAELIDDLLGLARVTQSEMHADHVDLGELAQEVMQQVRGTEPERALHFEVQGETSAWGDRRLLRVLLWNLLENAWKYSRGRERAEIRFSSLPGAGPRVFAVRDNGAGFEAARADRLFTPFARLHSGDEFEGSGIGLATVRRIVQRHGGRIWGEGEPDKGAVFYFTLGVSPQPEGGGMG
jgi:PAS domain S-box-containing protein